MAQGNRGNREPAGAMLDGSLIIVPVEDGTGHGRYRLIAQPVWDGSPEHQMALAYAMKALATRDLQGVDKKAVKASQTPAASGNVVEYRPVAQGDRVETVAIRRTAIARRLCGEALARVGKPNDEAHVAAYLSWYLENRAAKIEAELVAELSKGYTPTKRGAGATASGSITVDTSIELE